MTTKRIVIPFAETGDKSIVPDSPSGTDVNYQTGYPSQYEEDPEVTPETAKFVERDKNNQILNDITGNIKLWQEHAYPDFIIAAVNGGVPFPYNKGSIVTYVGADYISIENANEDIPTSAKWKPYNPQSDNVITFSSLTEAKSSKRLADTDALNIKTNTGGGAMWDVYPKDTFPLDDYHVNHDTLLLQLVARSMFGSDNLRGYEVFDVNFDSPYRMLSDYEPIAGTTFGVAHTGQSLAEGGVGGDSVSGVNTASFPDRSLMFSPQTVGYSSNTLSNVPVDLVENDRVTIGHSLVRHLCTGNDNINLFSGQAWGGKAYSEIKKGGATGVYEKVIQQVTNAKAVYSDIKYLGVTNIHGEQDGLNNNLTYEADLNEWQLDFDTDIKAVTGQAENVIMYICQTASGGGYNFNGGIDEITFPTPLSQLAAHVNNANIIMPCSKYHLPYADHSHIKNISQRILGEYYAKAFAVGAGYEPLRPTSFNIVGSTIVIDFSKTGLVFDTALVQSITDSGFSYRDDSARTITDVSLTGSGQITITLSGTVGLNAVVGYAYHNGAGGATNQINGLGDRGNLRDADPTVSLYDGSPLYNWCVIFREELN